MLSPSSGSDSVIHDSPPCPEEDSIYMGHVTLVMHDSMLSDASEVPESPLNGMGPNQVFARGGLFCSLLRIAVSLKCSTRKPIDNQLPWLILSRKALWSLWQLKKEQMFVLSHQCLLEIPRWSVETGQDRPSAYPCQFNIHISCSFCVVETVPLHNGRLKQWKLWTVFQELIYQVWLSRNRKVYMLLIRKHLNQLKS